MKRKLGEFFIRSPVFQRLELTDPERVELIRSFEDEYLAWFLNTVIQETEEIMEIDPHLQQKEILEIAAERIAKDLDAGAASIRLFDIESLEMTSFGAYGLAECERLATVPVQDSIAGRVVQENRSISVPSILKDPLYKNKEIVRKRGFHSLLAVPLRIPTFMGSDADLLGALQIYFKEENRYFTELEVIHAELLARRVSYVLAKKKIFDLQQLNNRKEKIVNKIFVKLSNREGIKLKDLFTILIPELGEFLNVQSCSLFTVSDDQKYMHLEAAYPLDQTYHEPGYTFTVSHHPYFRVVVQGTKECGDQPFERIDPAYVLIKDPERSQLISPGVREFVKEHQIHSILLVGLKINTRVRHVLTFYATDQKQYFTNEEIELLTFFGKEIMKALRLEFMGDMLHDFKNPAIAIAGFASRAQKLLESDDLEAVRERLVFYLDIVVRETARLQDLALAMTVEGREEMMDLSRVAHERFRMNEEVIRESKRSNIDISPPEIQPGLFVYCPRFGLERVVDNLLNNATKAIPKEGGGLAMRCYREESLACLEIRNDGEIPADQVKQVRKGEVKGRGLNIIYRFIQSNHGKIDIRVEAGQTLFTIKLPLQHPEADADTKSLPGNSGYEGRQAPL